MTISKEFKVGLFMVIALVLLYFGFNFLKGIDFFSSNHRYFAVYKNVDKLAPSSSVYMNGFKVGRVSEIEIIQKQGVLVLVELEIDADIKLTDSTIAILTGDILGDKSIILNVFPGSKQLVPDDTLKSALDRGMVDFLQENAAPVATNLQTTLGKFNVLVDEIALTARHIDTLLANMKYTPFQVNKTLVELRGDLGIITGGLSKTLRNVDSSLVQLKPTFKNLKVFSDSLSKVNLKGTLSNLEKTTAMLNKSLARLQSDDNTLGKLLTEKDLYINLNNAMMNLDSLLNHFDENPKHFMAPLGMSNKKIEKERRKQAKANEE